MILKDFFKKITSFFKKDKNALCEVGFTKDLGYKEEMDLVLKYNFNGHCRDCVFAEECRNSNGHFCDLFSKDLDKSKKTFLIIDDNKGITIIIKELLYELQDEGKIDLDEWNILDFHSKQAIIFLLSDIVKGKIPKIDSALIDITFGSIIKVEDRKIKLNGIHLAIFLFEKFKTKIKFYTGNNLNTYIKDHKIKQICFKHIFKEDLENYIIKKDTPDEKLKEKLLELLNE